MKEDKEERNGGTACITWGHDECPSTAQLVYPATGRAGGTYYNHAGGGGDTQCQPLDPNFLPEIIGHQAYTEVTCMELNIKLILTAVVLSMATTTLMYHVQFVMSVIVLQSTWFLLSTHAPVGGQDCIMVT